MKNGDMAARDKLIRHNLRLVAHIVKKYYASSTDQEDLISIGTIGLIKAVNSFDNTKGARFATYAARCIENEVLMQFRAGKKSQNDVSIQEPIDSDKDGNSLTPVSYTHLDVYKRQVYVCTPNRSHSFITVDALHSGKHVMCEKPMAINYTCLLYTSFPRGHAADSGKDIKRK